MTFTLDDYLQRESTDLVARCRGLLHVLHDANTVKHDAARLYFENLTRIFEHAPHQRGKVAIGVGSGRCGSTSLTAILRMPGCVATHENPVILERDHQHDQFQFHMTRMGFLEEHVPLTFDISPGWIHYVDLFLGYFPEGKIIGLKRDLDDTVTSFAKVKTTGDTAQLFRYVADYHAKQAALAAAHPAQYLEVATERLDDPTTQHAIFAFLGVTGEPKLARFNVGPQRQGSMFWF